MTDSLVERVARALAINHGVDPDEEGPGRRHVAERDGIPSILMDHAGPLWEMWVSDARVSIAAMRVPVSGMLVAVGPMEGFADYLYEGETDRPHIEWWQAMIDRALEE